jgi:hypothetical protein
VLDKLERDGRQGGTKNRVNNSNAILLSSIIPHLDWVNKSTIRLEPAPPIFLKTLYPIYGIQSDIFNYVE